MPTAYGRDLDLNLLRVFATVTDTGSVTKAASRLYLTQPAVSAALRRLTNAVGAPLFARSGRGLVLSSRGERLRAAIEPHLQKLVEAALEAPEFDPQTSTRTLRLGLADAAEVWLLPQLLRVLEHEAPGLRIIVVPVQFRTAPALVGNGVDIACTVADDLPANIRRAPLLGSGLVCPFDPRFAKIRTLTEDVYFAHEHVIVSYNGDLRGVVEDVLGKTRKVRVSVSSFAHVGALVDGSARLATVPQIVARTVREVRPHLVTRPLPFTFGGGTMELLWPQALDDDPPAAFVREKILAIAHAVTESRARPSPRAPASRPRRARGTSR